MDNGDWVSIGDDTVFKNSPIFGSELGADGSVDVLYTSNAGVWKVTVNVNTKTVTDPMLILDTGMDTPNQYFGDADLHFVYGKNIAVSGDYSRIATHMMIDGIRHVVELSIDGVDSVINLGTGYSPSYAMDGSGRVLYYSFSDAMMYIVNSDGTERRALYGLPVGANPGMTFARNPK